VNGRRVLAILAKDLRDALRDGRILVLLLLPIGLAVFYNATIGDDDEAPRTRVAIVDPAGTGIGPELRRAAAGGVEVRLSRARDAAAARRLVARDDAAFAVVAERAGGGPVRARVLLAADASPAAQSAAALVPTAAARAAGGRPPAQVQVQTVAATDQKPYEVIGTRTLTLVMCILLLAAFVAVMVVPMLTGEELEKGTFGALRLAATGSEILLAKALAGVIFAAGGIAVTVLITGLGVQDPLLFVGAALALVVSLVGFGLLLGLLVANANAINTYGGVALIPLIVAAGAVFFVESGVAATVLDALPFTQATKLLADAIAERPPFGAGVVAWLVIAAWGVVGYALLGRIAARREL
jgi:ABC-type multidrug transport system permease subunit